jgi:hypothetical protein
VILNDQPLHLAQGTIIFTQLPASKFADRNPNSLTSLPDSPA